MIGMFSERTAKIKLDMNAPFGYKSDCICYKYDRLVAEAKA